MDPLHIDPPAAVVRPAAAEVKALIAAGWRKFEEHDRGKLAEAQLIGAILIEQKRVAGHGNWERWVADNCPFGTERAREFIRTWVHRADLKAAGVTGFTAAVEHLRETKTAGTRRFDDDGDGDGTTDGGNTSAETAGPETGPGVQAGPQKPAAGGQNDAGQNAAPAGPKRPSEWSKEYRNRVFGLKVTLPRMHKKLVDGETTMPADELWKFTAWMCRRCVRLGPPPVKLCETCAANREAASRDLLQSTSEPANPDDPTSPPEPAPDKLARLRKLVIATQREATAALNDPAEECVRLRELLTACRVVDYQGEAPRFRALSGVAKVVDLAAKGDVDVAEARHQYEIASGAFVPPVFERKRKKGA